MINKTIKIFTLEVPSFQELFQEKIYQIQEKTPLSPL
jgi:hypothetical protein